MATPTLSPLSQFNSLRAKYFVFAFIGLMIAYVLYHNEHFLIDAKDPVWNHYESFKWWLLPHAVAGACALLLAPMQFSDRLRQRFTKMHRVVGRIYVAGFSSPPRSDLTSSSSKSVWEARGPSVLPLLWTPLSG